MKKYLKIALPLLLIILLLLGGILFRRHTRTRPPRVQADSIVIQYEDFVPTDPGAGDPVHGGFELVVLDEVTLTAPDDVAAVLELYHSIRVSAGPLLRAAAGGQPTEGARYHVRFLTNGEETGSWHVNAEGVTSFRGRQGNHSIKSEFDLSALTRFFDRQ